MTINAWLFMWDCYGIEAMIPITQYENKDKLDVWNLLQGKPIGPNPLGEILSHMKMRAQFNTNRHYEIYAVDCVKGMDEEFWRDYWENTPQEAANLIREKGIQLYSDRRGTKTIVIT